MMCLASLGVAASITGDILRALGHHHAWAIFFSITCVIEIPIIILCLIQVVRSWREVVSATRDIAECDRRLMAALDKALDDVTDEQR